MTGTLKGYDQLMNLVLDDVKELLRGMISLFTSCGFPFYILRAPCQKLTSTCLRRRRQRIYTLPRPHSRTRHPPRPHKPTRWQRADTKSVQPARRGVKTTLGKGKERHHKGWSRSRAGQMWPSLLKARARSSPEEPMKSMLVGIPKCGDIVG